LQISFSLLCISLLVHLFLAQVASAKSDWVEDTADQTARQRANSTPQSEQTDSQAGITNQQTDPSSAGPSDNAQSTDAIQGAQSPDGPLKARVTRFDQASPGGALPPPQGPVQGPSYAAWTPFAPPQQIRISSETFRHWLSSNHTLAAGLTAKDKGKILEVQGSWDDASHALRSFGLPYTRISANDLAGKDLRQVKVMVVDCGSSLPAGAERVIRDYVYSGGFLLTTDWALDSCLTQCFPGYLEPNGNYSEASVVDAIVVSGNESFVKGTVSPSYWKLEKRSQFVRQVSPNVQVLARSRGVLRQDPFGQGILAATFNYGQGRVLHLVGHFDTNSTGAFTNQLVDPSPGIVVSLRQALAANFIMSALSEP
jgi:hypothetical protein